MLLACACTQKQQPLLVFAAVSTSEALEEIGQRFQQQTGEPVQFSFGASSGLARQILAGAPADLFLSADAERMDQVAQAKLLQEGSRVDVLSNHLVVVTPSTSPRTLMHASELLQFKQVSLADPEAVPAGRYAKAWLQGLGLWETLRSRCLPQLDARAALTAVETRRVDAGIVYSTDALHSQRVHVAYRVSAGEGPHIVYPVAQLRGGRHPVQAQRFLSFLRSEEARRIWERHGFVPLMKEAK